MQTPELLSDPVYHNEDAARAYIEQVRWSEKGRFCPHCGTLDMNAPVGGPSMGKGWYYCSACKDKFTCRNGTVMERSHIPLHKWLLAFRLMASSKKGVSAHQIHRTLGITYKSAWFLMHRVREAMMETDPTPLGGDGKTIEVDETYYGRQKGSERVEPTPWKFSNERGWHRDSQGRPPLKIPVVTLVERGGRARSIPAENVTASTLRRIVLGNADTKSALMTDQLPAYRNIGRRFASHESVNHSQEEWVRGQAHTNTVEGFFSIFKRGMIGVYQHCAEKHLHRYAAEFDFRYSNRSRLGIEDGERTERAIRGVEGKRLTYRRTRRQERLDEVPFP
jgi:transposase-like protein